MVTSETPFKERMKSWLKKTEKVAEERERLHPGEMERINKQLGFTQNQLDKHSMMRALRDGKFSEHHIKIVLGMSEEKFDDTHPIIIKSKIYAQQYSPATRPWSFWASRSGAGKTTAIHSMIISLMKEKKIVSPGYIVHSDFIEAVYGKKTKVEDLYKFDFLVIDDFFKKEFEGGSLREQGIIKKLIDYFYRFRKGLLVCADVPMDDIHARLDQDEYADQICYRVLEKCGYNKDRRFVYGWNDIPNMRK
jgi:DNA replication protein DnaC